MLDSKGEVTFITGEFSSIGIPMIGNKKKGKKIPIWFAISSSWSRGFTLLTNRNPLGFESVFCVSYASFITTLLIDYGPFVACEILLMRSHLKDDVGWALSKTVLLSYKSQRQIILQKVFRFCHKASSNLQAWLSQRCRSLWSLSQRDWICELQRSLLMSGEFLPCQPSLCNSYWPPGHFFDNRRSGSVILTW